MLRSKEGGDSWSAACCGLEESTVVTAPALQSLSLLSLLK